MNTKRKPVLGETLFRLNTGNAARHCEQKLVEVTVTRIGRKYFTCAPTDSQLKGNTHEFHIDTWRERTDYCQVYALYEKPEEWYDERETTALLGLLRQEFTRYGKSPLSLAALRQIKAIIDKEVTP